MSLVVFSLLVLGHATCSTVGITRSCLVRSRLSFTSRLQIRQSHIVKTPLLLPEYVQTHLLLASPAHFLVRCSKPRHINLFIFQFSGKVLGTSYMCQRHTGASKEGVRRHCVDSDGRAVDKTSFLCADGPSLRDVEVNVCAC